VCRWRRGDAVSSDAVTFANREATTVGKVRLAKGTAALPTAWFANSIGPCCWQIRWTKLLAKEPSFANSLLCQQHRPKLLAKPARASGEAQLCQQPRPKLLAKLARLVGKAHLCQQLWPMLLAKLGIFLLFFRYFLAFNLHIKSTHQHMNQNTTYISTI
jgi:hypothetical protein